MSDMMLLTTLTVGVVAGIALLTFIALPIGLIAAAIVVMR